MVVLQVPIVPKPCHLIQTIAYICSADILYFRVQFPQLSRRVSINRLSDEVALNMLLNIDTCPDTQSINKQRLSQIESPQR